MRRRCGSDMAVPTLEPADATGKFCRRRAQGALADGPGVLASFLASIVPQGYLSLPSQLPGAQCPTPWFLDRPRAKAGRRRGNSVQVRQRRGCFRQRRGCFTTAALSRRSAGSGLGTDSALARLTPRGALRASSDAEHASGLLCRGAGLLRGAV